MDALNSDQTYGLYNMTGHIQVDLDEQVKAVIQVFGGEKKSPIIYRPEKPNSTPSFLYSMDKAKRDFGFEPKYTSYLDMMVDYKKELESDFWKRNEKISDYWSVLPSKSSDFESKRNGA